LGRYSITKVASELPEYVNNEPLNLPSLPILLFLHLHRIAFDGPVDRPYLGLELLDGVVSKQPVDLLEGATPCLLIAGEEDDGGGGVGANEEDVVAPAARRRRNGSARGLGSHDETARSRILKIVVHNV
jgi:hypothetical protein